MTDERDTSHSDPSADHAPATENGGAADGNGSPARMNPLEVEPLPWEEPARTEPAPDEEPVHVEEPAPVEEPVHQTEAPAAHVEPVVEDIAWEEPVVQEAILPDAIPAGAPTPDLPPPPPPVHETALAAGDGDDGSEPPVKPRIHKLRLAMIVIGLTLIAFVSTIFGIMMAVSTALPDLENRAQYRNSRNSVLTDVRGKPLGVLTDKNNRILVESQDISSAMKHAIIAIEDRRFYEHNGVDYKGIARALWQDVRSQKSVQGGSTIQQQFVKNALAAQSQRTVLEKLREAALAYHLNRKWSKSKILKEYLNSVYFGNGAYGIESAARVYWEWRHQGCGETTDNPCAALLTPAESATVAGIVASPSSYDPVAHPAAGLKRRNLVLKNMRDQGYLSELEYQQSLNEPLPTRDVLTLPEEKSAAPYFTTWIKQQVVDRFGAQRAFGGGLKIKTTIDLDFQDAASQAVQNHLPSLSGPRAALVAIDNKTGEVRAMVGGDNYSKRPFNLATNGQRQPGSSFKPFVLAAALTKGISPGSVWPSQKKQFVVPNSKGKEFFVVNNYEGNYSGAISLAGATIVSDNSVFAEVGIKTGINRVARTAEAMGIRTPVSHNYAITLGGLKEGVTPLDMAHAYETFPQHGNRVTGTLGAAEDGPVGIHEVKLGGKTIKNKRIEKRVLSKNVADTATEILHSVVLSGTGKAAQTGEFAAGKTGTTENYGDAWFVGFTEKYTIAVWVGYPDRLKPMKTDFNGGPVAGGTFPAEIWHDFVVQIMRIDAQRAVEKALKEGKPIPAAPAISAPAPAAPQTGATGAGTGATGTGTGGQGAPQTQQGNGTGTGTGNGTGQGTGTPAPTPKPKPAPTPAPAPTPNPGNGGNGGTGTGGGGAAAPAGV